METHQTITAVQEMKTTLKEILNVLKDIKEDFKTVSYSGTPLNLDALIADVKIDDFGSTEIIKPTEKVKGNVETT